MNALSIWAFLQTSALFVALGMNGPGCAKRATPPAGDPPVAASAESPADDPKLDPDIEGRVPAPAKDVVTIALHTRTEIEPTGDGKMVMEIRYPD